MHICWKEEMGKRRKGGWKDRGMERGEKKGVRERWRADQKGQEISPCPCYGLRVPRPALKFQGGHTASR